MQRCIYEVRGTNDPIDGDSVCFDLKADALDYAKDFPAAEVYCICVDYDNCDSPEGFCVAKKEYRLDECGNFCDESLESTVDQDLSDNRQPAQDFEPEYDEPVDGNAFRKHENGIKESYDGIEVSVDEFKEMLEDKQEIDVGYIDDFLDVSFEDGGVYACSIVTAYYDEDALDPYTVVLWPMSDDGAVEEGDSYSYGSFEAMIEALSQFDFIECLIKF